MAGLEFDDFNDFMLNRYDLKSFYENMPYKVKREYKRYVYSFPYKESVLDAMWCFLNEPYTEWYYEFKLLYLYDKYGNKGKNE